MVSQAGQRTRCASASLAGSFCCIHEIRASSTQGNRIQKKLSYCMIDSEPDEFKVRGPAHCIAHSIPMMPTLLLLSAFSGRANIECSHNLIWNHMTFHSSNAWSCVVW